MRDIKYYTLEDVKRDETLMKLIAAARKVSPGRKIYIHPKSADHLKVISVDGASHELCTLIGKELDPEYDVRIDDMDTFDFGVMPVSSLLLKSLLEVTDI